MVNRSVRAKNSGQALKRARGKYPSLAVTKVNWKQDSPKIKGEKLYQVVAHKKKGK